MLYPIELRPQARGRRRRAFAVSANVSDYALRRLRCQAAILAPIIPEFPGRTRRLLQGLRGGPEEARRLGAGEVQSRECDGWRRAESRA